ncbi:MAG: hypothetical protein M0Z55_03170 [Peptococcaceae bacterium]|nr:hypothetical protein [Peptococcaceae bacterium]
MLRPKPIIVKPTPPSLHLADPKYVNNTTMVISGSTDPGATLLINGVSVAVQADGTFTQTYKGTIVSQIMRVEAISTAGVEDVADLDIIPPNISARDGLPTIPPPPPDIVPQLPKVKPINPYQPVQSKQIVGQKLPVGGYSPTVSVNKSAPKPYLTVTVPNVTNKASVIVSGRGVPNASLIINGSVSASVGADGTYAATVPLTYPGYNQIIVDERYPDWGFYYDEKQAAVTYVTPPQVNIAQLGLFDTPMPLPSTTNSPSLTLKVLLQDADLANGLLVTFGSQAPQKVTASSINYVWQLTSGTNLLPIKVQDDAGNTTVTNVTVTH